MTRKSLFLCAAVALAGCAVDGTEDDGDIEYGEVSQHHDIVTNTPSTGGQSKDFYTGRWCSNYQPHIGPPTYHWEYNACTWSGWDSRNRYCYYGSGWEYIQSHTHCPESTTGIGRLG
jgi:hypothetical protein